MCELYVHHGLAIAHHPQPLPSSPPPQCAGAQRGRARGALLRLTLSSPPLPPFSVLVHSGGVHGGHYYAYIRPDGKQWLKFDDDRVDLASAKNAMDEQFGEKGGGGALPSHGEEVAQEWWRTSAKDGSTEPPPTIPPSPYCRSPTRHTPSMQPHATPCRRGGGGLLQ